MMKQVLYILCYMCTTTLFAQTDNYTTVFNEFKTSYNTEKYDDIFDSFSADMQSALPLETTKQFLAGLKFQVGKILRHEYVDNGDDISALYKTQFEHALLGVLISIDGDNKIAGLLIQPYEEPKVSADATVNNMGSYDDKVGEHIFEKAKKLPHNSQLSIAIIQNGKASYYGAIREDSIIRPIDNQSKVFEIGSISKIFTSTVLASLVDQKKLKLTDPINTYFDFSFKNDSTITFESLANHTSGLPKLPENLDLSNIINPYKTYGSDNITDYLKDLIKLSSDPTDPYAYSNLGAGLLGYTLGLSQESSFQELLQKTVFDKYKLTSSYTSTKNIAAELVTGLDKTGNEVSNWDFDVLFGAGGILSTVEDLVKFAEAQFDPINTELTLTRTKTTELSDKMDVGLGWHIIKSDNGNKMYWHNGGTGGYSSSMTVDIANENAVIILSNVGGANSVIDDLAESLTKTVF